LTVPEQMTGRSWLPLAAGAETPADWRDEFLFDFRSLGPGVPAQLAVRTETHKLIVYPDSPADRELYDLVADPHEAHNLVEDPEQAEVLAALERRLSRLVDEREWSHRVVGFVPSAWLLGPVPPGDLEAVRSAVLALGPNLEGAPIEVGERSYAWRAVRADERSCLPLGASATAAADRPSFLAFPVRRTVARDPYVQLHHAPFRRFRLYVNGEEIPQEMRPNHISSVINPPLDATESLLVLELTPGRPGFVQLLLDAPVGSLVVSGR
jgi:hypothetical protein